MKPFLLTTVTGPARPSSTPSVFVIILLLSILAPSLPAAAQSRGFFLANAEVQVGEAAEYVTLSIGRCCGNQLPAATVELWSSDFTAKAGLDYVTTSTNLVFSAGQTNVVVRLPLVDDGLVEGPESFYVDLRNPTGGTGLDPQKSTRVRIVDDERGFFLPAALPAYEPTRGVSFAVARGGGPNLPAASVELVTADGTAQAGSDYTTIKTTLQFAAGQTQYWFTVPISDDAVVEGLEGFTISLQNPNGGTPLDPEHSATVVIQDDDRGFNFGTAPWTFPEEGGSLGINVFRAGANLPAATVELVTADGTAKAGLDYTAVTTTLTFAAGETAKYVPIQLLNDALIEGEETLTIRLQNPVGYTLDPQDTTSTIRIQDNDRGFAVRGVASDYGAATENQPLAHFEVAIVGDFTLTEAAAVTVSTEDGTAKAGADYQATSTRLVFAPGERVKSFTVPIFNDALAEGDEAYFATLSQPVAVPISYLAQESRYSATILDNELGYRLGDSANPGQARYNFVFREGETASVTVWRDGDFEVASAVKLNLANYSSYFAEEGTATPGVDFPTNNLVLTFGPGETRKTATFVLPDDGANGSEKTFFLTLEAGDGIAPVQPDRADARAFILNAGVLPSLVDPDFDLDPPATDNSYNLEPTWVAQADGKVVYVADRRARDGQAGALILRVLPDGRPDPTWQPATILDPVSTLAVAPDGRVLVAPRMEGGEPRLLIRLQSDGTRDAGFAPVTDQLGEIRSLCADSEGRVLATDGSTVIRFLADGRTDPAFSPFPSDPLQSIRLDPAGNPLLLYPGGLVRLKPDGTPDPSLSSPMAPDGSPYSQIQSVLPLADGRLLIVAPSPGDGGWAVIRLRSDGTTDPGFAPQPAGYQAQLVRAANETSWLLRPLANRDLLGWALERLLPDGNRDPAHSGQQIQVPIRRDLDGAGGPRLMALADGNLLVGNSQLINGQPRHRLAKLQVTPGLRVVLDPATARVPENAGNATLKLLRSGPVTNELTLGWATEPISAGPGADYTPASGTVTFAVGRRDAVITVPVLDNDLPDRDRLVRLRFTAAPGILVPPPAGFAIANDDPGFPPDGIRALADGSVLLRPTGWLEASGTSWGWMAVYGGPLEDMQAGSLSYQWTFREPYPEIIAGSSGDDGPWFFRVVNPNPTP